MSQYATTTDLGAMGGLPAAVLAQFTSPQQNAALVQASGVADGYLEPRYRPPLSVVPVGFQMHVCSVASYFLMGTKGFDPEQGANILIVKRYNDAIRYFELVSNGKVVLTGETDATPTVEEGEPQVVSEPPRGW